MVALPTDVARSGKSARSAFETVFRSMVSVLERSLTQNGRPRRATAQGIASLCIGGMVVARAPVDRTLADELRDACMSVALDLGGWHHQHKSKNAKSKAAAASAKYWHSREQYSVSLAALKYDQPLGRCPPFPCRSSRLFYAQSRSKGSIPMRRLLLLSFGCSSSPFRRAPSPSTPPSGIPISAWVVPGTSTRTASAALSPITPTGGSVSSATSTANHASPGGFSLNTYTHTYLVGPRVSLRNPSKFNPFAQFLIGGSRLTAGSGGGSSNQFAYSFGGGVDVGLLPHLALRPQLDYVGLRNSGQTVNCTRLSLGFVVHF